MTRSSSSTSCASRTQRATSIATSCCSSAPNTVGLASTLTGRCSDLGVCSRSALAFVPAGRVDDLLHDSVPDDVARTELDEHEALDPVEHVAHQQQPRPLASVGKVDLCHVAGHDHLRTEPQAREEHLHLL